MKGRTPLQAAAIGAELGGLLMLIPAIVFRYGQSLQDRKAALHRRPMAAAIALVLGGATASLTYLTFLDLLQGIVLCSAAAMASSRLTWRAKQ
jgi:hypothetical protein